jgi:protein-S-isoprenylcysteine O-methyltransferase Ste14
MKKIIIFAYGILSYVVSMGTLVYAAGFMGNLWVPRSIDAAPSAPLGQALLINLCLLAVFAVQHSVMARAGFKRWLTRFIPAAAERSTFVLASSLALILLFALWEPMGGVVWDVQSPLIEGGIYALYGLGWLVIVASTFLINHFDLFGLRQVWLNLVGREYQPLQFKLHSLYRYVRHPLYVGFFIALWATPTMTIAHLVFSVMCSAYILIGTRLEERDLRRFHPEYVAYERAVPGFVPRVSGKVPATLADLA